MSTRYHWQHAADIQPELVNAGWLRRETADTSDLQDDATIGLTWDDGGGGAVVYGSPAEMIMFLRRALATVSNYNAIKNAGG